MPHKQVLFVCTGNYYRSRFAEIYFNFLMQGSNWSAFSKGFVANNPNNIGAISPHTLAKLKEYDISIPVNLKYPEKLSLQDIHSCEMVVAVQEREHLPFVERQFPEMIEKFIFWNIDDVHDNAPDQAIPLLKKEVEKLVDVLNRF